VCGSRFEERQDRAQALASLASSISPGQHGELMESLLEAVARLPRHQALTAVSASINISVALGGAEALEDIRRAISDTASWYP